MPYAETFALQRRLQQAVIDARPGPDATVERPPVVPWGEADADHVAFGGEPLIPGAMHLLLLEHDPPVITVSRRQGAAAHVTATPAQLEAAGVRVEPTDRGGDVTYHGPGQLVVYPILDLNAFGLRLHGYMRLLESVVIDTLAAWGLTGDRDPDATGVWLDRTRPDGGAKVSALGVRVSRWVSMHGLSLNVDPDLSHFDLLVPCGLHGRPVTSMRAACADAGQPAPTMDAVKARLVASMTEHLAEAARAMPRGADASGG